jgi:HK97 family phage portal protein
MPVISSFGQLVSFEGTANVGAMAMSTRPSVFDSMSAQTYAAIYRTQPNIRTVVDFLARNIAQLGLHVFRRVSDLDRVRLAGHDVAAWTSKPNPATTRYRLFESLMIDMGIYYSAYWLKLRTTTGIGLVRIPPESISPNGWLLPESFTWTLPDGRDVELPPSQVVHFTGFDPCDPLMGISPIETLRQTLSQEAAAASYRAYYWRNAARIDGVIERPAGAPKWDPTQKQAFREQWQDRFVGPSNAGGTPILDDGMTFKPTSHSARDSEFTEARKLSREECAAAYHVPLPMVGILEHATFSNIKEQHKQLYQDCLGPWLTMIQEELERQLLVESADQDDVYLEFNISEKLKGSFEEQAASLFRLVGRPIMTANEGRARLNLTSIKDDPSANALAMPLNTGSGAIEGWTSDDPAAAREMEAA